MSEYESRFGKISVPYEEIQEIVDAVMQEIRYYVNSTAERRVRGIVEQAVFDAAYRGVRITESAWLSEEMHHARRSNLAMADLILAAIDTTSGQATAQAETSV